MKSVRYTADAIKELKRHGNMAARIRKAVNDYAVDARAHTNNVTRLVGLTASRMRVGEFRVIFEDGPTEILVTKVGPRSSVYD